MLPKIEAPSYSIVLPISKQKINFRPFLVKEQKILLMAMESKEKEFIQDNIKQILTNCCLTEGIDIDNLPMVDVEFYFLNIRAKSVGEVVETRYKCENTVGDKICGNLMDVEYNVLDVNIKVPQVEDTIQITPTVGIKMKYPNFSVVEKMKKFDTMTDIAFELVINCIDYIYDNDTFYYAYETPREELLAFIESLTKEQFSKLEDFIEEMPSIEKTLEMKCSKCGYDHKIVARELDDFFI